MSKGHILPSCGDPECYWWWHRFLGLFMGRRPYPWEDEDG